MLSSIIDESNLFEFEISFIIILQKSEISLFEKQFKKSLER